MSARISYMYKTQNGCDSKNTCSKCGYYESKTLKGGYKDERCSLHRHLTKDEVLWKGEWMACKAFLKKGEPRFKTEENGQMCLF